MPDVPEVPDEVPEPDDVPAVPELPLAVPDEVLAAPADVPVPDEVPAVSDAALAALVWTPTPAGEHPNSVTDKTNTAAVALENLMGPSWSSASHMSLHSDRSITTEA